MIFHISWWVFEMIQLPTDGVDSWRCAQHLSSWKWRALYCKSPPITQNVFQKAARLSTSPSTSWLRLGPLNYTMNKQPKKKRKPKIFYSPLFFCSLTRQTYRPSHSSVRTLDRINRTAPVPQRRVRPSRPTIPASFVIALVQTSIT